jgi:hypothetical protein
MLASRLPPVGRVVSLKRFKEHPSERTMNPANDGCRVSFFHEMLNPWIKELAWRRNMHNRIPATPQKIRHCGYVMPK